MTTREGGCMCGAIRYKISGEPAAVVSCACRDCQRASGGGPVPSLVLPKEQLRLTRGRPRAWWSFAASGRRTARHFCEVCGTPLFGESTGDRGLLNVKLSSLDEPAAFQPQAIAWTSSAQPWMQLDPSVPHFLRGLEAADEAAAPPDQPPPRTVAEG